MKTLLTQTVLLMLLAMLVSSCGPENTAAPTGKSGNFNYPLAKNPAQDPLAQGFYRSPGRVIIQTDQASTTGATDMQATDTEPAPTPKPQPQPVAIDTTPNPQPKPAPVVIDTTPKPQPRPEPQPEPVVVEATPIKPIANPQGYPTYTVKSGDTLAAIAKQAYGDAHQWRHIAQGNPQMDAMQLQVGQVILLPPLPPQPAKVDITPVQPPAPEPSTDTTVDTTDNHGWVPGKPHPLSADKTGTQTIYIVNADDSLSSIALKFYGDTAKRYLITRANPSLTGGTMIIGQRLIIPPPDSAPKPLTDNADIEPAPSGTAVTPKPTIHRAETTTDLQRPTAPVPVDKNPPSLADDPHAVGDATVADKAVPVHVLSAAGEQARTAQPHANPNQAQLISIAGPDPTDIFTYMHVIQRTGDTRSGYEYMSLMVKGDGSITKRIDRINGEAEYVHLVDLERAAAFLKKVQDSGTFKLESKYSTLEGHAKKVKVGPPSPQQTEIEPGYYIGAAIDGNVVKVAWPGVQYAMMPPEDIRDVLLVIRLFAAQVVKE